MTLTSSCLHPCNGDDKMALKRMDVDQEELNLSDKAIESLNKISNIFNLNNLKVLTLSNNKIKSIPQEIGYLHNLEHLNLFNNYVSELPSTICNLSKLRYLNAGMNNLSSLPRGFNYLTHLEVLDLAYNFLDEHSLYPEFFSLENLKALYLSDNEFEVLPADIRNLKSLQILAVRDNHLSSLPNELSYLTRLRELIIQNNRLRMILPELSQLDLNSPRSVLRIDGNPLDQDLVDQLKLGISHVLDYIRTDQYQSRYIRNLMEMSAITPPPKNEERKHRKLHRLKGK